MVMRNVPMYQAKIPIRGGGGVIDLSSKENETKMLLAQLIGEALGKVYGPGKRQRQERQQIGQISPILSREGDRATNIRDALAAIQAEQRPTGMGGVFDFLNPASPARGRGSEIEQSLLAEQMQQPKQPTMKIVVGDGKTWLVNPTTGEKRDLGIVPPRSKVGGRSTIDIINDMGKVSRAAGAIPQDALEQPIIDAQMGPLRQELISGLGLEEAEGEVPREVRRTEPHWYLPGFMEDWLKPDIPAHKGKVIRKKTPITEALKEPTTTATHPRTGKKIQMPAAAKEERHLVRKTKERPPKPKEYPNAVWNEEHQLWTVVKNGRLMGIK